MLMHEITSHSWVGRMLLLNSKEVGIWSLYAKPNEIACLEVLLMLQ